MNEERPRLFVGVPVPEELRAMVRTAQRSLDGEGLRLTPADQLHVTLAFLGEVGSDVAAAAQRVVSERRASMGGEVVLGGIVLLPTPRKARVVALGIEDGEGVLAGLFEEVWSGLAKAGGPGPETRPFRPHLTIARVRAPGKVHPRSDSPRERWRIRSVCLYRSRLTREGARYEVLTEAILRDRSDTGI